MQASFFKVGGGGDSKKNLDRKKEEKYMYLNGSSEIRITFRKYYIVLVNE